MDMFGVHYGGAVIALARVSKYSPRQILLMKLCVAQGQVQLVDAQTASV